MNSLSTGKAVAVARLREVRALELRACGWTFEKIAAEIGYKSVSSAHDAYQRRLKYLATLTPEDKRAKDTIRQMLYVRLREADDLHRAALAGYEESKKEQTKTTVRKANVNEPIGSVEVAKTTNTSGNPAFIGQAVAAVRVKLEITSKMGDLDKVFDNIGMDDWMIPPAGFPVMTDRMAALFDELEEEFDNAGQVVDDGTIDITPAEPERAEG